MSPPATLPRKSIGSSLGDFAPPAGPPRALRSSTETFRILNAERYAMAVHFATDVHRTQVRKGTTIPYVSHPLAVSALVLEFGGDEDQAIAGLLHDVVEDCDVSTLALAEMFGGRCQVNRGVLSR